MFSKNAATIYEIRVKGCLDEHRLRLFEGQVIAQCPEGNTLIRGAMDQAALHGVLSYIRDLGLTILSVQQVDPQDGIDQ